MHLSSLSFTELEDFFVQLGTPKFRAKQVYKWLFQKSAKKASEMTDLSVELREKLIPFIDQPVLQLEIRQQSPTDKTIKSLYKLQNGLSIETVLIPDFDEEGDARRLTVCVSSQVGCAMGCTFCATGQLGFKANLHAGEIFMQVQEMQDLAQKEFGLKVTNIVFMGMGEPLQNYENVLKSIAHLTSPEGMGLSTRRITLSTVGLARRIQDLANDGFKCNLAISLHAPTSAQRSEIMPVNRAEKTDLNALKKAVQQYYAKTKNRVTYEYCIFDSFNDSPEDALNLAKVVNWCPSKVNIILYNQVKGVSFERSREERLHKFIQVLVAKGVTVTVRRSRGQDIDAACGQLASQVS